jgi:hypothetical protein
MGAIDNFLRRFGYAKLDRYGLILTGDDRVLSSRPAVLDDGLGGKIVGWTDDDLAAMELEHWGAARKVAPAKPVAAIRSVQQPAPRAAQVVAPAAKLPGVAPAPVMSAPKLPGVSPFAETVALPAPTPARPPIAPMPAPVIVAPAPAPAPVVAAEPELTEDEWEWEIAMARARAAAEDVQEAAASAASSFSAPKRKTSPGFTANRAKPVMEPGGPAPTGGTEPPIAAAPRRSMPAPVAPLAASKFDERTVEMPRIEVERKTVIPVPQLPVAVRPSDVRPAPYAPAQPRRMPKGTARLEDTVRTQPAPPANDDRTSPYVTLPTEVKPAGYAHTKRVAAKQS